LLEIKFHRTHNIQYLVDLIENTGFKFPSELIDVKELTNCSVETRYTGEYEPVTEDEYNRAIRLSTKLVDFIDSRITNINKLPFNQE